MVFNQKESEHEIVLTKLKYSFSLKLASMICFSIVSAAIILCLFFGATKTLSSIIFTGIIIGVLAIITFISSFKGAGMI